MCLKNINSTTKDDELLDLMAQDSTKAFEYLYIRYKDKLKKFCEFMLKSKDSAEDIVQEIFVKIWQNRKNLNTTQSFSNYIFTAAKNKSLNELRSYNKKELIDVYGDYQDEVGEETTERKIIFEEYQKILNDVISKLPKHKQEIFLLSREEKLSHKEIAKQLTLSPHTVQNHISDSLLFIKNYFLTHADLELYSLFVIIFYLKK